jgi:hypothetical protein
MLEHHNDHSDLVSSMGFVPLLSGYSSSPPLPFTVRGTSNHEYFIPGLEFDFNYVNFLLKY